MTTASLPPSLSANKRHYKPSPVTDLYSRTRWPWLHSPHPLWDDVALLLLHQPPAEIFMGTCERLKKSWGAVKVLPVKASRWERHGPSSSASPMPPWLPDPPPTALSLCYPSQGFHNVFLCTVVVTCLLKQSGMIGTPPPPNKTPLWRLPQPERWRSSRFNPFTCCSVLNSAAWSRHTCDLIFSVH